MPERVAQNPKGAVVVSSCHTALQRYCLDMGNLISVPFRAKTTMAVFRLVTSEAVPRSLGD